MHNLKLIIEYTRHFNYDVATTSFFLSILVEKKYKVINFEYISLLPLFPHSRFFLLIFSYFYFFYYK